MKPHWYYITTYFCVLCGQEDTYRERRYDERPEEYNRRHSLIETACDWHFM